MRSGSRSPAQLKDIVGPSDTRTMDLSGVAARRWTRLLARTGVEVRQFAQALGGRREHPGDLLIVGVPGFEPWHFTAHLGEQASRHGRRDLVPTLLRWQIPEGAPAHLAVPVDSLLTVSRHQTVLAIDPFGGDPELLDRIDHAHRRGRGSSPSTAANPNWWTCPMRPCGSTGGGRIRSSRSLSTWSPT